MDISTKDIDGAEENECEEEHGWKRTKWLGEK
jgi:hypothetical protein